ncbi:Nitric oxide-responding transcriptional regulator Dnr (Crp/Fnr family) [hydrothermal vent metagenome]|uniref:Nitric oxide-responding transcriptional regulator Dnr (Crp/Fnr family) n=1 Tax=hydrothermal vent metagenome TaxID=652676 RepID=A0A1W1BBV8_9ZZZZ
MKRLLSVVALSACLTMMAQAEAPKADAKADAKTEVTQTKEQGANVINLAGKQRMLTQKMSKEALFIAKGINVEANTKALKKTAELFDKTLKGLVDGDEGLKLPKTTDKDILAQLAKVSELWASMKKSIDAVAGGKADKATLEAISKENLPLLKNMNEAVQMYAKASGSKLSPEMAKTINRAGKQRMLTQKMTKELLLVANGIDADANKENAKKTGELFESTLKDLTDKCKNEEIKTQLGVVAKLWADYKDIIVKADTSDASLKKAEEMNIPLLKNMNKAVKMYEASAK